MSRRKRKLSVNASAMLLSYIKDLPRIAPHRVLGSTWICNLPGYAISDNSGGYLPGR